MSAGAILFSRLSTHAGTAALVSTRVYPLTLPQTPTFPAIVYQRISGSNRNGTSDFETMRYQVNCWASTYAGAEALAIQTKAALEEYGTVSGTTTLAMTRMVNELDDYDFDLDLYRVILDFMLDLVE